MAINYYQFFNPMYYFVDNTGQPLNGGYVFWYESEDHSTLKPIYKIPPTQSDPAGTQWPNPLPLNAAGFQSDNYGIWGADDEPYYVEVRVGSSPTSQLILSEDNFSPPVTNNSGGGGSGAADNNVLVNGQFTYYTQNYNVIDSSVPTSIPNLAPGNWFFAKSNASASDTITFNKFVPGQTDVPQNPVNFFHYSCTSPGTGETFKQLGVIFRSTPQLSGSGVSNFAGQTVTFQFTAQSTISSVITINIHQNFGTAGSTQVDTAIDTITLTPSWPTINGGNPYISTFEVPSISGKTIGTGGDLFSITLDFPLNLASDVQADNFKLEITNTASTFVADTVQQLQYKSVGLQFPALTNVPNLSDGNYQVLLTSGGFQYQALAGKSELWYLNTAPTGTVLCDGHPYYSYQHYNLAQLGLQPTWGIGSQAFTTSVSATPAIITATTNINGSVASGNSGTSGFTFTQTSNGSPTTKAIFTVTIPAAGSIIPGTFFLPNSTIANYYVWFSLNNLTIDPGPFNPVLAGKFGIKVIYTGSEIDTVLGALVAYQLNVAHFKVPDVRGLFPRMPNFGATGVLPAAQQLVITSAGNDTGVNFVIVGLDQFGAPNTETLAGTNAAAATSVNFYSAITSITPSTNTSVIQVGIVGAINVICVSQNGATATVLLINGIYQRDPDYLTRYALITGGPTADNVGSEQQSQNLLHNHSHPSSNGGNDASSTYIVQTSVAVDVKTMVMSDSGGNQSNPNNVYVNFIIYR